MSTSTLQRRKNTLGATRISTSTGSNQDSSARLSMPSSKELGVLELDARAPRLTLMDEIILLGIKDKEGYFSFWNDSISYTLRGCILIELALRGRIGVCTNLANPGITIQVLNDTNTGEVLLDETLKLIKNCPESLAISDWINLLSGETWNLAKKNYQLRQVRERLAKGLVDKGVLRTEKRNFLLFDMPTHPLQDLKTKSLVINKCLDELVDRTVNMQLDPDQAHPDYRFRKLVLIGSAYAANVLENAFNGLEFEQKDRALEKADQLLNDLASGLEYPEYAPLLNGLGRDGLELIAGVMQVFSKMDNII